MRPADELAHWVQAEHPDFNLQNLRLPGVFRVPELRAGQDGRAHGAGRGARVDRASRAPNFIRRLLPAGRAGADIDRRGRRAAAHRGRASRPSSSRILRRPSRRRRPRVSARPPEAVPTAVLVSGNRSRAGSDDRGTKPGEHQHSASGHNCVLYNRRDGIRDVKLLSGCASEIAKGVGCTHRAQSAG